MTLSLQSSMVAMGPPVYYQENWHVTMESHLLFLMNSANTTVQTIDPHDAYKYEGDLWSLLQAQGILPQYFYPIMRANGMYSPLEFRRDMTSLLIPSSTFIDNIRNLYTTVSNKLM